ncbi:MAG: hypothetical protein KME01_10135 [Chroococcus sp. CMT-3BRIN-NPC107]|jgi:hypothetical protein|nr:hypothetical protein [Chroococcus sp. CMT-3BRIN-NPC107]
MKPVRDRKLLNTVVSVGILAVTSLLTMNLGASGAPTITVAIPGCVIKGNISVATGKKLYHLPGMRNYEATIIDLTKGKRWFCTEAEAQDNGWIKAQR